MARYATLPDELKGEVASHLDLTSFGALKKVGKNSFVPTVSQCCIEPTPKELLAVMKQIRADHLNPAKKGRSDITLIIDGTFRHFAIDWTEPRDWYSYGIGHIKEADLPKFLTGTRLILPNGESPLYFRDILKKRKPCLQNKEYLKKCFHSWMINYFEADPSSISDVINWTNFYETLESILPEDYKVMDYYETIFSSYRGLLNRDQHKKAVEATLAMLNAIDYHEYTL